MICTNDTPVTDAELEAFYGKPVTEEERKDAIQRQSDAFDTYDVAEIAAENAAAIYNMMKYANPIAIGLLFDNQRRETIARRASIELYGKPDVIKAWEVKA